jgi:hypothetical protein
MFLLKQFDVPSIAPTADDKLGQLIRILCHSGIDGQVTKEAKNCEI